MPFPFLLPFFISHPSFSSFLRCHCAALPCLLLSLFRSSVTRKRTLIAWHSAQTNTSGHRSGERERERETRTTSTTATTTRTASECDASSYGTDGRIGWKHGKRRRRTVAARLHQSCTGCYSESTPVPHLGFVPLQIHRYIQRREAPVVVSLMYMYSVYLLTYRAEPKPINIDRAVGPSVRPSARPPALSLSPSPPPLFFATSMLSLRPPSLGSRRRCLPR